eukprot:tig00020510_g9839.t1
MREIYKIPQKHNYEPPLLPPQRGSSGDGHAGGAASSGAAGKSAFSPVRSNPSSAHASPASLRKKLPANAFSYEAPADPSASGGARRRLDMHGQEPELEASGSPHRSPGLGTRATFSGPATSASAAAAAGTAHSFAPGDYASRPLAPPRTSASATGSGSGALAPGERERYEARIRELEGEVSALQGRVREMEDAALALEDQVRTSQRSLAGLMSPSRDGPETPLRPRREGGAAEARAAVLEGELRHLGAQLDALREESDAVKADPDGPVDFEGELNSLIREAGLRTLLPTPFPSPLTRYPSPQVAAQREVLAVREAEAGRLRAEREAAERRAARAEAELAEARRAKKPEQTPAGWRAEQESLAARNQELQAALLEQRARFEARVSEAARLLGDLQAKQTAALRDFEAASEAADERIAVLSAQVARLEGEKARLAAEAADLKEQHATQVRFLSRELRRREAGEPPASPFLRSPRFGPAGGPGGVDDSGDGLAPSPSVLRSVGLLEASSPPGPPLLSPPLGPRGPSPRTVPPAGASPVSPAAGSSSSAGGTPPSLGPPPRRPFRALPA